MNILDHLTKVLEFASKLETRHPSIVAALLAVSRRYGREEAERICTSVVGSKCAPHDIPFHLWPAIGVALFKKLDEDKKHEAEMVSQKTASVPRMSPLKVAMLLHFQSVVGPFAPESTRRSDAYVTFVKELLAAKLIQRVKPDPQYPGWAYRTTERGDVLVDAICVAAVSA